MQSTNVPPTNHIRVLDGGQGWIGLIDHMGTESTITNAARVSFGKMKETFDEKDNVLLKYLIENKHLTPLEHVKFTFSVHCPLFVRGQWHRHRAGWSYNEISRRYTEVDMEYYIPEKFRVQSENNKQASVEDSVIEKNQEACEIYAKFTEALHLAYEKLLELGVCKEQARGILPQTMFTTFWATVDLRNLLHFIELRDDDHAQKEIREYAKAMKELIRPYVPHVVEYIEKNK
jgi:thymidylate synthase (FAD)